MCVFLALICMQDLASEWKDTGAALESSFSNLTALELEEHPSSTVR